MMDIPLDARIECADGLCGNITYVVLDPTTQQITHIVVKEKKPPHPEHLVPVEWISDTGPDVIRLRWSREELARQASFVETHFTRTEIPRYRDVPLGDWPFTIPKEAWTSMVKHRCIPEGELVVHRGAHVEAVDGHAGQVREFLIDPVTKRITHLVLSKGHLWRKHDVTVSASEIDHMAEDKVHLKLNKHSIVDN
jgi:hypothetical protein